MLACVLARATAWSQAYAVLHEFSARGGGPLGGLIQASNGKLYGTLGEGGESGYGSVYSLTPDGSGGYTYAEVYGVTAADNAVIFSGGLVEAADGGLYGGTYFPQGGVIYRVDPAGTFTVVHTLSGNDGAYPSQLIQAADGTFYGVASLGGSAGGGTAFKMDTSGNLTVLHPFSGADGTNPVGPLLLASDGFLYGECESGAGGRGTIFRMSVAGALVVLHTFTGPDGSNPSGGLIEGTDGNFYGVTFAGGDNGLGTAFRISSNGTLTTLHSFAASEGSTPNGRLLQASDGKFYGATYDGPGTLFAVDSGGGFTTIHSFTSAEGKSPDGALLEIGGQLVGNAYSAGPGGYGTAFTSTLPGAVTVVASFAGPLEGNAPSAGLLQASDGLLYGTAAGAGASGNGTLFKSDLTGSVTLLHSLDGATEGGDSQAALIQASDGNLYGAAGVGGSGGKGTVFRSDTSGTLMTLHSFSGADGDFPRAALVQGSDGNFYGTTQGGGDSNVGTAFRVDGSGGFASLHSFPTDESYPSGLVQASDGDFYGSTSAGPFGGNGEAFRMDSSGGVTTVYAWPTPVAGNTLLIGADGNFYGANRLGVYRLDPAGNLTVIHAFQFSEYIDQPWQLIQGTDGDLWGASLGPVGLYRGAVFRVHANGDLTVAHRFLGPDGADPYGSPILASDGMLYGTTSTGGPVTGGVLYRIDPASVIDVVTVAPGSGPASGTGIATISGPGFQPGATVTIGSVPATNVVVSGGQITASVPALGAGAAYDVVVTNPDLSSATRSRAWVADSTDVPPSDLFYGDVTRLFRSGVSVGCGGGAYCVDASVTRAQMSVFLLKGKFGPNYAPPPATGTVFADVAADAFAAAFIEDLFNRGISQGCGNGNYCPDDPITRAEMAPLLLKTLLGPSYTPPPATGTVFEDVAAADFAADFIEDIAARGITSGCSMSPPMYCPTSPATRGQMATFVVSTFGLP